jgi:nucleotide-binding universal stress UspA family protein
MPRPARILIPVDGSEASQGAIETALSLANGDETALALLAVIDVQAPGVDLAGRRRAARGFLLRANLDLPCGHHAAELLREGPPVDEIVGAAREWGADLVVLACPDGSSAGGWPAVVAGAVARRAPCPVMMVGSGPDGAVTGPATRECLPNRSGCGEASIRTGIALA